MSKFKERIRWYEGFRSQPYADIDGRLTFGYGRTFITRDEAEILLANDEDRIFRGLENAFPWFDDQPESVQLALMDMAYHMGINGLKGFKKMLSAIEAGDYQKAYEECLDSRYGRRFTRRARPNAEMIREGKGKG
jgi:lysozyme